MNLQNSAEEIIHQGEHDWKLIKYLERVTTQGTYFGLGSPPFAQNGQFMEISIRDTGQIMKMVKLSYFVGSANAVYCGYF